MEFHFILPVLLLVTCCSVKSVISEEDEILKTFYNLLNERHADKVELNTPRLREILKKIFQNKEKKPSDLYEIELEAKKWIEEYGHRRDKIAYYSSLLSFNYLSNITDSNMKAMNEFSAEIQRKERPLEEHAKYLLDNLKNSKNETLLKILKGISISTASKNESKNRELLKLKSKCEADYGEGTVELDGIKYPLEPNITTMLAKSRNPKVLEKIWIEWRNSVGRKIRKIYPKIIEIEREIDAENGQKDPIKFRLKESYGDDKVEKEASDLYDDLKPLYEKLHAYVRYKLHKFYGNYQKPYGYMKANLLGNMWAQQWPEILDIVAPYPDLLDSMNFSNSLSEKNFTVVDMFKTAEKFFKSITLFPMVEKFWKNSMFTKPTDGRQVVCHPAAFDLGYKNDYRIKMCAVVAQTDFLTIHHEMGHIEYYMSYRNQSYFYRNGANPAFHEAIGDTIALSAGNPTHLKTIGLFKELKNPLDREKRNINYLLQKALEKLTVVPWSLVICKWTWAVRRGEIKPKDYNKFWWYLRKKYQGIKPPVKRDDDIDMDAASKYHVASFTPYLRYLFSFVAQFQFHEALCKEKKHEGPVYLCDIYKSTKAGNKLKSMLELGSKRPWREVLEEFTGTNKFDSKALRNFFEPLEKWLDVYIETKNIPLGW
ncbi:DgyrCDS8665 [Dimorphilus gyrociliatus]|uniref:Angiotensin-converting enzyme n=1 Tax=Dimorphilus gyrociliatus TaxID=2664684 RepID=A0A7I8VX62_9ANNE|nr:DgyrCDS8665 [Dimorphilus gyrociliatus]